MQHNGDTSRCGLGMESSLAFLMRLMEAAGSLSISFEDLVGVTYDHPELRLPEKMRMHTGPLCRWAKQSVRTHRGLPICSANKYLANRKVVRQCGSIVGQCHLGLTDICRPLIYRGQIMGVFYYGSVAIVEHLQGLRERVINLCQRQQLDRTEALAVVDRLPTVRSEELTVYEGHLSKLTQVVGILLEGLGLPADCYHSFRRAKDARMAVGGSPRLVLQAVRVVNTYLDHSLTLESIAKRIRCHPRYLGRIFQRSMGMSVADYLLRTRIERACGLLKMGRLDVTMVAYEVGYTDKSNFSRAFRKIMGVPPGEYRKRFQTRDSDVSEQSVD